MKQFKNFIFLIIILITWRVYSNLNSTLPFYTAYDMDSTTTQDTMAIQSGIIPSHINHPGFGMYLITKYTHILAYVFNQVPILDFTQFRKSLEPILVSAEMIDFFRSHSPVIGLFIIILLWFGFQRFFHSEFYFSLLILIVLCTDIGIYQQVHLIRSELYSVFYFAIAFFISSKRVMEKEKKVRWYYTLSFLEGFFLGLMLLSKVQSILLLILYPMVNRILNSKDDFSSLFIFKKKFTFILYCLSILFFLNLLYFANSIIVPVKFATFTTVYRLNIVSFILLAFSFSLLLLFFIQKKWFLNLLNGFIEIKYIHYIFIGFLFSFLVHFLMFTETVVSVKYLLYDAKMLFFRNESPFLEGWLNRYLLKISTPLYLIHFSTFLLAFFSFLFTKRKRLMLNLFLVEIIFQVHILIADRSYSRDFIWLYTILNFFSILNLYLFYDNFKDFLKFKKVNLIYIKSVILSFFFLGMIFSNQKMNNEIPSKIFHEYNEQARLDFIFTGVYGEVKIIYDSIVNQNYPIEVKNHYAIRSSHWNSIKSKLKSVFILHDINLQCVSFIRPDHQVWYDLSKDEAKLIQFSEKFSQSLLVDPSCLTESTESYKHHNFTKYRNFSYNYHWLNSYKVNKMDSFDTYLFLNSNEDMDILDKIYWKRVSGEAIIKQNGTDETYIPFLLKFHDWRNYKFLHRNFMMLTETRIEE